ncbi:MAG: sigma-54-dependent Fis family transcriptional regulator [Magnetococcales bacterium]|nr:sigma-54-dependent Fis family transcriptional regulator [Magnetococcales bacterium]
MNATAPLEMMGTAPAFLSVVRASRLVAGTDATVLIQGETGVGKELLAQSIHEASRRAAGSFVPISCPALSETLAESELFGHAKGAFTGAIARQSGRIAAAHRGTLFLDEVGDMPLSIQPKMLRFLENGECQSLGQEHPQRVNVRVIAATNWDLSAMVAAGQFRRDLFHRLQVVPLVLPPLRERGHDVVLLANAFLTFFATRHAIAAPAFSRAALALLCQYAWPGNIRELRNLCERGAIFHAGQEIGTEFIQAQLSIPALSACPTGTAPTLSLPDNGLSLDLLERDLICAALDRTRSNRTHAAKLLGLSRDALLYRMKKHALR